MFSRRIPTRLQPTRLAAARAARGDIPYDLTVSNPTAVGLPYPADLLASLADPAGLTYDPAPLGLASAREVVARELSALGGRPVRPDRILLTASTSEAYALLFKLLCDPGQGVLVPAPSYPLFEHLAHLEGVVARVYALDPTEGWQPSLPSPPPAAARALVLVNPNNPTGTPVEPDPTVAYCARHGLALIADEVFLDCPLSSGPRLRSFCGEERVLTFVLGGLSKYLGLPQLKLAWTVVSGPAEVVGPALERLEFIADQYLSVSTPVQLALPSLFEQGRAVREAVIERARHNLRIAESKLEREGGALESVRPAAGFTLVLRHPNVVDEEQLALELLEQDGVAVQPGHLFDFPTAGYVALSLLPAPAIFEKGFERLLARLASYVRGSG